MPTQAVRQTLGEAIKARRLELGLTQVELAVRVAGRGDLAFRQSDVSRLERGSVTLPHRDRLECIAAALGLPLGELLARSGWSGWTSVQSPAPESRGLVSSGAGEASTSMQTAAHRAASVGVYTASVRTITNPRLAEAVRRAAVTLAQTEQVLERSKAIQDRFQRAVQDEHRHPESRGTV